MAGNFKKYSVACATMAGIGSSLVMSSGTSAWWGWESSKKENDLYVMGDTPIMIGKDAEDLFFVRLAEIGATTPEQVGKSEARSSEELAEMYLGEGDDVKKNREDYILALAKKFTNGEVNDYEGARSFMGVVYSLMCRAKTVEVAGRFADMVILMVKQFDEMTYKNSLWYRLTSGAGSVFNMKNVFIVVLSILTYAVFCRCFSYKGNLEKLKKSIEESGKFKVNDDCTVSEMHKN